MFENARSRLKKDYEGRKKAYDRKSIPPNKFSVGQLVRRKLEDNARSGKFAPRYDGPFEITRLFENNPNVVEIKKHDGTKDTVNVSKIHHWELAPPELMCDKAKTPADSSKTVKVPRKIKIGNIAETPEEVDNQDDPEIPEKADIEENLEPQENPLISLENAVSTTAPTRQAERQIALIEPRPQRNRQQSVWLKDYVNFLVTVIAKSLTQDLTEIRR